MNFHVCLATDNEKQLTYTKKTIVRKPKIIVVPILKNVEETIDGIINKIENGLDIPPVK